MGRYFCECQLRAVPPAPEMAVHQAPCVRLWPVWPHSEPRLAQTRIGYGTNKMFGKIDSLVSRLRLPGGENVWDGQPVHSVQTTHSNKLEPGRLGRCLYSLQPVQDIYHRSASPWSPHHTATYAPIGIRDITHGTWFPYKPHIEESSIANEECWEVAEFSISKQYHVSWTASANQNLDPTIPAEYRGLLYRQMILDSSCILQRVSLMIIFWRWPLAPAQHPALLYKAFNQRSIH